MPHALSPRLTLPKNPVLCQARCRVLLPSDPGKAGAPLWTRMMGKCHKPAKAGTDERTMMRQGFSLGEGIRGREAT